MFFYVYQHARARAHNCAHARTIFIILLFTCCSRSSRECWNVEYYKFLSLERYSLVNFDVDTFVDNLLNCWKCSNMHKTICATFCGKLVESVKSVENAIRGSSVDGRKVTSCSSYGAPRLAHDLQCKILLTFFQKNLDFFLKIWYNKITERKGENHETQLRNPKAWR